MWRSSTPVVLHENWWVLVSQLWQKMEPSQHRLKCRSDPNGTKQNWVNCSSYVISVPLVTIRNVCVLMNVLIFLLLCVLTVAIRNSATQEYSAWLQYSSVMQHSVSYNNTQMHYILMLYCYVVCAFIDKFAMVVDKNILICYVTCS